MRQEPRVCVVGSEGYLGRHVCRRVINRGWRLFRVDALLWKDQEPKPDCISTAHCGSADTPGAIAAIRSYNPTHIICLAALAHAQGTHRQQQRHTHFVPTNLFNQTPNAHFIFASSLSVLSPNAQSDPYARMKRGVELHLTNSYRQNWTVFRFGTLYGPGADVESWRGHLLLNKMTHDAVRRGVVTVVGSGKERRAVYGVGRAVEDLLGEVRLSHTALHNRAIHNRADEASTINDFANRVANQFDAEVHHEARYWLSGRAPITRDFPATFDGLVVERTYDLADWIQANPEANTEKEYCDEI